MNPRRPRILRNLKVLEVSGVDKGAGRGVKIMLVKREHAGGGTEIVEQEFVTMETVAAKASRAFDTLVDMHAANGMTRSAAISKILSTSEGKAIFAEAKNVSAYDILKMGGGEWPTGPHHGTTPDPEDPHRDRGNGVT